MNLSTQKKRYHHNSMSIHDIADLCEASCRFAGFALPWILRWALIVNAVMTSKFEIDKHLRLIFILDTDLRLILLSLNDRETLGKSTR